MLLATITIPGLSAFQAFSELGWVAVVVLGVIMLASGRLRTNREMQEVIVQRDARLVEVAKDREERVAELTELASLWQHAYESERDGRRQDVQALHKTLQVAELILDIVTAWDKALSRELAAELHAPSAADDGGGDG